MAGWKAAELEWGHGPRVFEMFLEPTCPYSNKAFGKIKELLSTVGEDKITVKVRLQSQPWHLYSGVIVRAILAASTLDNGRDAAWRVMEAVAAHLQLQLHLRRMAFAARRTPCQGRHALRRSAREPVREQRDR